MYPILAGTTTFLGGCLLFLVQPMLAKAILPRFGGGASVWASCMLFYQGMLFLGYSYAHWISRTLSLKRQIVLHVLLLAGSVLFLPPVPASHWAPAASRNPTLLILVLLAATIGLPYLLLSSTSPLVQSWGGQLSKSLPFRYYALSNFASLVALLSYPLLLERILSVQLQVKLWSLVYGLYVFAFIALAAHSHKASSLEERVSALVPRKPPALRVQWQWLLLSAMGSAMLLAVTNHLCQNIAPLPFLWVVPLAAYLLTFVVCFGKEAWCSRRLVLPAHLLALALCGYLLMGNSITVSPRTAIPAFTSGLFMICMYCHGELVRRKPDKEHLTHFYLMVALGGALGSAIVGFGAPHVLRAHYDLPIVLIGCAVMTQIMEYRKSLMMDVAWSALTVVICTALGIYLIRAQVGTRFAARNFYGSLRVVELRANGQDVRVLRHGGVLHGLQFIGRERRRTPTTYYGHGSGAQLAVGLPCSGGRRVGVIGLGAGTIAAYGQKGDVYRFYEIDAAVVDVARREFTFLEDSPAEIEIVLGDGRRALETEAPQGYDALIIDAFSGDSIPAHLLTRECFKIYLRHLKRSGVLVVHVSNELLDVRSVVRAVARDLGLNQIEARTREDDETLSAASHWVLLAEHRDVLDVPSLRKAAWKEEDMGRVITPWSDNYSSLFAILK